VDETLKQILTEMESMRQGLTETKQSLESELQSMKQGLTETKQSLEFEMRSGFDKLDKKIDELAYAGQDDVKAMINLIDRKLDDRIETKLDRILATQIIQGESINLLAAKQFQTETDVAVLKKVK
jgi:DNA anti-recombination protein RmuC